MKRLATVISLLSSGIVHAQPEGPHHPGHAHDCGAEGCAKSRYLRKLAAAGFNPDGSHPEGAFTPREGLDDTDVLHNSLDIEIVPAATRIAGSNVMTIRSLVDNLTEFTFRLDTVLTISEVRFNGTESLTPVTFDIFSRRVTLPRPIARGETFTLTIRYAGQPRTLGWGAVVFGPRITYTLSQPWYSARWWPTKDGDFRQPGDNSDKATFDIAITAPANLTSVSNGLLQSVTDLEGGRRKHHWRTNYPMSSYLACFAAAEYVSWSVPYPYQRADGTSAVLPLQFYATAINETRARRDAAFVPGILDALRPLFGEYPFVEEKYGIYEFNAGGGMEHQTMSGQDAGVGASITAHELAHQWWGDDVTCRTWSDIWLNEGFASYGDALYAESLSPTRDPAAASDRIFSSYGVSIGSTVYQHEIGDIGDLFDSGTVYGKGAMVLHQLRFLLGDDRFFGLLRLYRSRFSGSAATTEDFIACVNEVAGRDMSAYFDAWVYGPGGPRVSAAATQVRVNGRSYIKLFLRQTQTAPDANFYPHAYVVSAGDASLGLRYRVTPGGRESWHLLPLPDDQSRTLTYNVGRWAMFREHNRNGSNLPGPPKIAHASPGPNAELLSPLDRISITFSENVAWTANHFSLLRDDAPVAFTLAYDAPNQTFTLTPAAPLAAGRYTVAVSDALTANQMALDGELTDALPSGDGVPGGAAVYSFTVLCPADFNRDGFLDFFDYSEFTAAFESGSTDADFNRDAFLDFFDYADFVTAFEQGC